MAKFWSQIYKRWNPTNKIMFWLGIISLLSGLIVGGTHIINVNKVTLINSSTYQSPIIQSSSNISIIYSDANLESGCPQNYNDIFQIKNSYSFDLFKIKVIFPDDKIGIVEKLSTNQSLNLGQCIYNSSDCCIYHKFRINEKMNDEDFCWIFTTRLGHEELSSDNLIPTIKQYTNKSECINDQ